MTTLPAGWTSTKVGEIAAQIRGITYRKGDASTTPSPETFPLLRAGNITEAGTTHQDLLHVPRPLVNAKQILQPGDVLIASSSGSLDVVGKATAIPSVDAPMTFGAFCKVLRPGSAVDPRFFAHFFQAPDYRRRIRALAAGANINNLKTGHLNDLPFPLPPLPEQRRIAAILDKAGEVGARTEKASSRIWSAQLAIFRRRFGHPSTWRDLWQMSTIGELADSVQYGTSAKAGAAGSYPILRMGNVTMEGQLDLCDLKYLDLADADIAKYTTQRGDLLFNRTNSVEQVGKTGVVDTDESLAIAGYLVRVRLKSGISPNFVATYLNSPYGQQLRRGMAKAAVSQANINATQLRQTPIALPPASIQDEFERLVRRLQGQQKNLERMKSTTNRLTRSLQSRAFRGEL